jgi:hypothetical protein
MCSIAVHFTFIGVLYHPDCHPFWLFNELNTWKLLLDYLFDVASVRRGDLPFVFDDLVYVIF